MFASLELKKEGNKTVFPSYALMMINQRHHAS
jgi:hypothetical protein